jgi:polyhydroxyalkanoate synthase subunit PhaC
MPSVSVVRMALDQGFSVFVLEWLPGGGGADGGLGLADFALRLPERALERIEALTGHACADLAGHSLGGTLAAIFASRRPERAGRLVLVDAPLAFAGDGGPIAEAVAGAPPAGTITQAFGATVPGSAINVFSARAVPEAFVRQPADDALACAGRPGAARGPSAGAALDARRVPDARAPVRGDRREPLSRPTEFRRGTLVSGARRRGSPTSRRRCSRWSTRWGRSCRRARCSPGCAWRARPSGSCCATAPSRGRSIQHLGPLVGRTRIRPPLAAHLRLLARRRAGRDPASGPIRPPLVADLAAVQQQVVEEDAGQHRLAHRHGADADAGVVPALGHDLRLLARHGDRAARLRIDEVGLTAKRATISWPVEMPPRMPPAWFDEKRGPSVPIVISSAFSVPVSVAAAMPAPISTPLTALIDISAAAMSVSSLP